MKSSLTATILLSLVTSSAILAYPVQAEMTTSSRPTDRAENKMELKTSLNDTRKTNADKEIDRRIAAMTALIGRVNGLKRVTVDQKASLVAQLQTAINDLTALKAKITADVDSATLKTDKQSIVNTYRVFVLLMPKVEIMAHADAILETVNQANTTTSNFQMRWKASGKDLSSLQSFLGDRQAKLTDAATQAQNAITTVSTLQPTDYPANKPSLESARGMLKTSREDLRAAYQDLVKANQAFNALK